MVPSRRNKRLQEMAKSPEPGSDAGTPSRGVALTPRRSVRLQGVDSTPPESGGTLMSVNSTPRRRSGAGNTLKSEDSTPGPGCGVGSTPKSVYSTPRRQSGAGSTPRSTPRPGNNAGTTPGSVNSTPRRRSGAGNSARSVALSRRRRRRRVGMCPQPGSGASDIVSTLRPGSSARTLPTATLTALQDTVSTSQPGIGAGNSSRSVALTRRRRRQRRPGSSAGTPPTATLTPLQDTVSTPQPESGAGNTPMIVGLTPPSTPQPGSDAIIIPGILTVTSERSVAVTPARSVASTSSGSALTPSGSRDYLHVMNSPTIRRREQRPLFGSRLPRGHPEGRTERLPVFGPIPARSVTSTSSGSASVASPRRIALTPSGSRDYLHVMNSPTIRRREQRPLFGSRLPRGHPEGRAERLPVFGPIRPRGRPPVYNVVVVPAVVPPPRSDALIRALGILMVALSLVLPVIWPLTR